MYENIVLKLRLQKKISPIVFAKKLGVNRVTLFRFEKAERSVSDQTVVKALRLLGVNTKAIYRLMVLSELYELRKRFGVSLADKQIREVLAKFNRKNEEESLIYDILKKKIKLKK